MRRGEDDTIEDFIRRTSVGLAPEGKHVFPLSRLLRGSSPQRKMAEAETKASALSNYSKAEREIEAVCMRSIMAIVI